MLDVGYVGMQEGHLGWSVCEGEQAALCMGTRVGGCSVFCERWDSSRGCRFRGRQCGCTVSAGAGADRRAPWGSVSSRRGVALSVDDESVGLNSRGFSGNDRIRKLQRPAENKYISQNKLVSFVLVTASWRGNGKCSIYNSTTATEILGVNTAGGIGNTVNHFSKDEKTRHEKIRDRPCPYT